MLPAATDLSPGHLSCTPPPPPQSPSHMQASNEPHVCWQMWTCSPFPQPFQGCRDNVLCTRQLGCHAELCKGNSRRRRASRGSAHQVCGGKQQEQRNALCCAVFTEVEGLLVS